MEDEVVIPKSFEFKLLNSFSIVKKIQAWFFSIDVSQRLN